MSWFRFAFIFVLLLLRLLPYLTIGDRALPDRGNELLAILPCIISIPSRRLRRRRREGKFLGTRDTGPVVQRPVTVHNF